MGGSSRLGLGLISLVSAVLASPVQVALVASPSPPSQDPEPRPPLRCFQVGPPIAGPSGPISATVGDGTGDACTVELMKHTFGSSYGVPFVSDYTPPYHCGDFDRVIVNFTASSEGRQYDRLALMFLGDIEVWRTSTPEPSKGVPVLWTEMVDVTPYLSLWKLPQKVIFELGNMVNENLTGVWDTTLTATFFRSGFAAAAATEPAHAIIPISSRRSAKGKPSHFIYGRPGDASMALTSFPRNARRAVVTISANGQLSEEFWWANIIDCARDYFFALADDKPAFGPYREVQLLIDGQIAGAQWPFPVVFTGGYMPPMHRPIVGIGAFTLKETEIDVSAWLPLLCDGEEHKLELRVMGATEPAGEPGSSVIVPIHSLDGYWTLTAKIFVWLGDDGAVTTGNKPRVLNELGVFRSAMAGHNNSSFLEYSLEGNRIIAVEGSIRVGAGRKPVKTVWKQHVGYRAWGQKWRHADIETAQMIIAGMDEAEGPARFRSIYHYPVSLDYNNDNRSGQVWAELNQSCQRFVTGFPVFPLETFPFNVSTRMSNSKTERNAAGRRRLSPAGSDHVIWTDSSISQNYTVHGWDEDDRYIKVYARDVKASNNSVYSDVEVLPRSNMTIKKVGDCQGNHCPMMDFDEGQAQMSLTR